MCKSLASYAQGLPFRRVVIHVNHASSASLLRYLLHTKNGVILRAVRHLEIIDDPYWGKSSGPGTVPAKRHDLIRLQNRQDGAVIGQGEGGMCHSARTNWAPSWNACPASKCFASTTAYTPPRWLGVSGTGFAGGKHSGSSPSTSDGQRHI